ncbi:hypothetical protein AB0F65_04995 [Nocardia rhamnosiphila]|uniref:hypothetical protein n=1 Tax=Nocardia rhamnosiphila TaxID=426716 RepID=UPI0033CFEC69
MTAIFCSQIVGVSHLLHVDRYASTYGALFSNGRKRADLIGRAPSGWVVAEAKGRSRAMEPKLRDKLIEQKRSVLSIEGVPPWLALGCVASFPGGRNLAIDAFDPEKPSEDAIRLDSLTRDRYLYAYYLPFISALNSGDSADSHETLSPEERNSPFEFSNFGSFRVRFGLLREIAALTREAQANDLADYGAHISEILDSAHERDISMFPDGSIIQTDWSEAIEARDWLIVAE